MDEDQTKFWAILIGILVGVAVLVTVVDLSIKAAILDESNALKRRMNEVKWNGPGPDQANSNGASDNAPNNGTHDSDDVPLFAPRVEAPTVRARSTRKASPKPMAGTIEHSERNGNGRVETSDKPVDS
jgi:hypothetical protein